MLSNPKITAGLIASILGLLPLTIQAEDCCLPSYQPGTPLCEDEVCTMYPAFAGVNLQCGMNMFGYLEFLYWTPVTSRNYTVTTFEGNPLGSTQRELYHRCGFRPAFKIGMGMTMPEADDNWEMSFEYLWYHHNFSKTFSIDAPAMITSSFGEFTNTIYRTIRDRYHINYDVLSLFTGRPHYLGQNMIFSPYFAIKWLRRSNKTSQNLTRRATGLIDHHHSRISYSAFGGGLGMGTDWLMCWGLRFIGKIELSMVVPYSRRNYEIARTAEGVVKTINNPIRHLDAMVVSGLGIGWSKYFCCNRYHMDLAASFDLFADSSDMDFNANMFTKGTAILCGLTVSGRFDF
ncbi:MAG: hypothetical protein JSS30_02745 [Verrucomicrobia bacterium]|nr:hypothetical protein [Verrucomicrobiota bacterium]